MSAPHSFSADEGSSERPAPQLGPPVLAKPGRNVLIVEDETLVGMGLQAQLQQLGYAVIGQAATRDEAIALFMDNSPDLVLVDVRLGEDDGIELAADLVQLRRAAMIVVTAYFEADMLTRAAAAGVFGYLIKPVTAPALGAQIAVAMDRFRDSERLREEKDQLAQTLENRKFVERAKGILMQRLKLSEPDAHKRLQQESQKRRIGIGEIARRIIDSEQLLSGNISNN